MKLFLPTAALVLTSTTAFAELTPQDVLQSWRGFYAGFGATIETAAPHVSDEGTRFSDVVMQMNAFSVQAQYNFAWVDMKSNADGSIDITLSPQGYALSTSDIEGSAVESRVTYDLSALTIHAEGAPGDIEFTYDAPVITVHQSQDMPEMEISMTVAMENWQGRGHLRDEENNTLSDSGAMSFDSMNAKFTFVSARDLPVYANYSVEDFSLEYDVNLPRLPIPSAPQAVLLYPEDMVMGLTLSTGAALTTIERKTANRDGRFSFQQDGGELSFAFAENALSYGVTATGAELQFESPQEAGFSAAFERAHLGLTLPVYKTEAPAPFALAMALEELTVGPEIWARFDPQSTLSQAPASFAFSMNGTMELLVDLMDHTAFNALRGAPFELRSLSLSSLSLDFEGLGLTGLGDLTFNSERIDPVSGMPEAKGALDFSINGALGLLDKIGRLGLIEPMAIIGAKGALGMFATPNAGADSFSSRIEFSEGGRISVNGQPVR